MTLHLCVVHHSNWSSVGINTTLENRRSVTCTTTHLTSFAVLVDVNGPQVNH